MLGPCARISRPWDSLSWTAGTPNAPKYARNAKAVRQHREDRLEMPLQARLGSIGPLCTRKHLKQLGLLGCGGFGAVELVEHAAWQHVRGKAWPHHGLCRHQIAVAQGLLKAELA